jgi:cholesterol oxidase
MEQTYEAIVIGTGFGGAITGCRLAKKWPEKGVLILERGKRYPLGSFPRKPHNFARNLWALSDDSTPRPRHVRRLVKRTGKDSREIFDVRNFKHMDAVVAAGVGGGSLIYANVFMVPPDETFDERWPATCKRAKLARYYNVVKEVLGSRPIPTGNDPRRKIIRQELFAEVARRKGKDSQLVEINVFFGNDFNNPLSIGVQDTNRYGALQTSCMYCGECDIRCNYQAKNTLDLNYLFVAEHRYHAVVRTYHLVSKIVPIDKNGKDDPDADGTNGYRVYFRDLLQARADMQSARTNRVIVSAGSLAQRNSCSSARYISAPCRGLATSWATHFPGTATFSVSRWSANLPRTRTTAPLSPSGPITTCSTISIATTRLSWKTRVTARS